MSTGSDFEMSLPPDWDVLDLADATGRATSRRVREAVRRNPALGKRRRELTAVMTSAVQQSRDSGVRLAAGWAALDSRRLPVCAGLVVHVLRDATRSAAEVADAYAMSRDAAADRVCDVITLENGHSAARVVETRSIVVDRRTRTAVPTSVTRFLVPEPTGAPAMAMLTFTSPVGEHVPTLLGVFSTMAGTFAFRSTR